MGQKIVIKFGGTSMGNETAMRRSAEVATRQNANIIVVSATSGTTNDLLSLIDLAISGKRDKTRALRKQIENRHTDLANQLEIEALAMDELKVLYKELKTLVQGTLLLKDCHPKTKDGIVGIGERMSSLLFSQCLKQIHSKNVELLDAREIIATDDKHQQAKPNFDAIQNNCARALTREKLSSTAFVTQGFIGRAPSGASTTLGRGGSDYSAAIFAWAIDADHLEIWTDVAGIATTDPRICSDTKTINQISFQEAGELAIFGAKVLHPTTLAPCMQKNIPVFVGSSFEPEKGGTWIKDQKDIEDSPLVRALAMRKDQALLTLTTPKMLQTHGFLYQIFKIFNDFEVSIDAITTSEISVSLTVESKETQNEELIEVFKSYADLKIENDLELVSLIGNNIHHTPGLGERIFQSLGDINVRMICYGASKHNFCFIVGNGDGAMAINRLHQSFIGKE